MQIRIGYELIYDCPQPTPMILTLSVHYTRISDLVIPDHLITDPPVPLTAYRDSFGNWCSRICAPNGLLRLSADALVKDTGLPDVVVSSARQTPVAQLPDETLLFLLGSRYCETDRLSETAWQLFGASPTGWGRVQAICDYVNRHITFGYEHARPTKTAWEAFHERTGVCRDYAHLAIAFCRCMNIPARYCTGYLGDIGIPPPHGPMDFAGWFEAYLDGQWYTFDARNNTPRIGRVLIARGRDAADVAISSTFGPNTLKSFRVWTDEVKPDTSHAFQEHSMLVTFTTGAYADTTMFGEVALVMLKMMGHSATVPGAIRAEDVPAALGRLTAAIEAEKVRPAVDDKDADESEVSMAHRALPLINLLAAAARANSYVMWK